MSAIETLNKWKNTYPLYFKKNPIKEFVVTYLLFSRINQDDIENTLIAIEENLGIQRRNEIEKNINRKCYQFMTEVLLYGNYYLPEIFNRKTLMSAANPPSAIPSMTRTDIFVGDLYAPNVLMESISEVGIEIKNGENILDFGCSSARVLRNLYAAYPKVNWHGCDPQCNAVDWAKENFPKLNLMCNNEDPLLDYDNSFFDGSFAFSIWSHFSEEMAVLWLDELHRVTKTGGFLLLTTCGFNTIDVLIRRHTPRWSTERVNNIFDELISKGFVFEKEYEDINNFALDTSKYGMAYFIVDWLLSYIPGKWSIRGYKPARSGHQDVYILEKI